MTEKPAKLGAVVRQLTLDGEETGTWNVRGITVGLAADDRTKIGRAIKDPPTRS